MVKLLHITANSHVVDGRTRGAPLRLLLTFDGDRRLRLGGSGEDHAMVIDDLSLDAPFDMGPAGRMVVEDVTALFGADLEGAEVRELRVILLAGQRVGIRLALPAESALCIWVDGDELWWGDEEALTTHLWPGDAMPRIGQPITPADG